MLVASRKRVGILQQRCGLAAGAGAAYAYNIRSFSGRDSRHRPNRLLHWGKADIISDFTEFRIANNENIAARRYRIRKSSMANTAQARKRARQSTKLNAHNSSQRSTLRTAIKAVRKAIEAGDKAAAATVYQTSVATIDRIADKKIIHKNKAARHKSRLSAAIKALALAA
jgi:small subunit ribosomal protein S20